MNTLSLSEGEELLADKQKSVVGLVSSAEGNCMHIGKLSPGCLACFTKNNFTENISVAASAKNGDGNYCNRDCDYCWDDKSQRSYPHTVKIDNIESGFNPDIAEIQRLIQKYVYWWKDELVIPSMSFSGQGETLVHLDTIIKYLDIFKVVGRKIGKPVWTHLYTNGLLLTDDKAKRLFEAGLSEIRFHLGASEFSELAYNNLEIANKYFITSVETPALPRHRDKIFKMLPRINDIGVKHLNLGQVQVTNDNREFIDSKLGGNNTYIKFDDNTYGLEDCCLVYDVMKEVADKGYSYSVLDCSVKIKLLQRLNNSLPSNIKDVNLIKDVGAMIDLQEYDNIDTNTG